LGKGSNRKSCLIFVTRLKLNSNQVVFQSKQRLAQGKLKTLFKELKEQDKDEIKVKKMKFEGQEKGTKGVEVRRRFTILLARYNLEDVLSDDTIDNLTHAVLNENAFDKQMFKDKKLDRLWRKAEQQQFDDGELLLLKEEFQKYESRLSDYNSQVERVADKESEIHEQIETKRNAIDSSTEYPSEHLQLLKEKHREVKRHYNELEDQVLRKQLPSDRDVHFDEPRVGKLWRLALKVGFAANELNELRDELQHFESRLRKISYLEEHYSIDRETVKRTMDDKSVDSSESKHIRGRLRDLTDHVDKLERDLHTKIMTAHSEL
jgi:hypothetical protein